MAYTTLMIEREGPLAWILYNRPPVNARNREMGEETLQAVTELNADASVRVITLSSAVPGYFSSGADIKIMSQLSEEEIRRSMGEVVQLNRQIIDAITRSPKPFIASMNGTAVGAGLELALVCDLRLAAAGAVLGLPEVNIAFVPPFGGTQSLPRLVGLSKATELLLEGRTVSAEEALSINLVHAVYPADTLADWTRRRAARLAEKPPKVLGLLKHCLRAGLDQGFKEGLAIEARAVMETLDTHDFREGMKAFLEKRQPAFRGE